MTTTNPSDASSDAHDHSAHAKVVDFDRDFPDDIFIQPNEQALIAGVLDKFRAVRLYVGAGNFNLLGMDELFQTS